MRLVPVRTEPSGAPRRFGYPRGMAFLEIPARQKELLEYAQSAGLRKSDIAPPLWRWLWALGLPVDPPAFQAWYVVALVQGVPFGLTMSLVAGLNGGFGGHGWGRETLLLGVFAGAFFGLCGAPLTILRARAKLGLRSWTDFGDASGKGGTAASVS